MQRVLDWAEWGRRNSRFVIGGAVLAALLIGGLLYRRVYQADQSERASAEYLQLQNTVQSGNSALALKDLQNYVRRYDGTTYADEARLQLAQFQLDQGQAPAALTTLQGLARSPGGSDLAAQAALLKGAAQGAAGQRDQAVATYLDVAKRARLSYLQEQALVSGAALREQGGDFAGAAALYRQLVELASKDSQDRTFYEMRLAEAEARARK